MSLSYHFSDLPTPAAQTRADGWTPALQQRFVEALAATGIVAARAAHPPFRPYAHHPSHA